MTTRVPRLPLLLLCGIAVTALPACRQPPAASFPPSTAGSPPAASLSAALPAGADVRRNAVTGAVERVRGEDLSAELEQAPEFIDLRETGDYEGMALMFLASHRREFRLDDPLGELSVSRVNADRLGFHQVRFGQAYRGLRVLNAELIVHFDSEDRIYLVEGRYLPTPSDLSIDPPLSEQDARRLLTNALGDFEIETGELVIAFPPIASVRPAYRFEARRGLTDRREVLVDAESGRTLRDIPLVLNGR